MPTILPDLRPLLHDQTAVLPLQNGVEAPEQIGSALGEQHPLVGLCRIISARIGPGHIRHTGAEPYVAVGEIDGHHSKRVERILAAFDTVGVTAERPADIIAALWEKFLFITAVSGLGAVTRVSIGELRALRQTRALLADSMREVMTLARARGIELPPDTVARTMDFIDALPESGTASMQRDIMAAVPSELESQNGAVARMAAAAGVEAPINTLIHTLLLPLERQARKNVAVAGKPA